MNQWKQIISVAGIIVISILLSGCQCNHNMQSDGTQAKKSQLPVEMIRYESETQEADCQLCGNGTGTLLPAYWGEDNVGIIDLNTFELAHIEINPYDDNKKPQKKIQGGSSFRTLSTGEEGMFVWGSEETNRGYYSGKVQMKSSKGLDLEKTSKFLCTNCLNIVLNQSDDDTCYIGMVNFKTREIRLLESHITAFIFDNFYVSSEYYEDAEADNTNSGFELLIFYCPPRYEKK